MHFDEFPPPFFRYRNKKLFVGNVGDSRCIACSNGLAEALSLDHKPGNALERERIEQVRIAEERLRDFGIVNYRRNNKILGTRIVLTRNLCKILTQDTNEESIWKATYTGSTICSETLYFVDCESLTLLCCYE